MTDNFSNSIECSWQIRAENLGYGHISVFCSIGQFASHITDLLRDNRFDKHNFDKSPEINDLLFRFYTRILLISSEIFTDFQDLYIIANEKLTTKQIGILHRKDLNNKKNEVRKVLANGGEEIKKILDFINKICKHKTANFHLCNNHIEYLFEDFHENIQSKKKRIELGNINNYTSYDNLTLKKNLRPNYIVIPKMKYIIDLIINSYSAMDTLFLSDQSKFKFVCNHYEDK